MKVPTCGSVEVGVSEFGDIAGETRSFGFEGLFGLVPAAFLHVFGDGDADESRDPAETEESLVAASGLDATSRTEVDKYLGSPADELPPESEELSRAAGSDRITEIALDEICVFEDGGGGRGFGVDGKVGEEAALGVGKGLGDEVEGRKSNQGIAQAAQAIDEDPFWGACHRVALVCLVWRVRASRGC